MSSLTVLGTGVSWGEEAAIVKLTGLEKVWFSTWGEVLYLTKVYIKKDDMHF